MTVKESGFKMDVWRNTDANSRSILRGRMLRKRLASMRGANPRHVQSLSRGVLQRGFYPSEGVGYPKGYPILYSRVRLPKA